MVRLRGLIAFCALAFGLGTDAGAKGWPQPVLGDTESNDVEILFTFDDGPNAQTTPQILDILAQHRIQAVFFLVGNRVVLKNKQVPAILERILREGHVIANHTMNHKDLCKTKEEAAIRDLDDGKEVIERIAKHRVQWFRAPFGARCDRLEAMLAERKIAHFHWDLDPQEWKHNNVERTVKYVTSELARAHGRNVLLMHDVKQVTVKALPVILQWIADENAKRAKSRKRKIKILQAPNLAFEQLPPGLGQWLVDATAGLRELPKLVASILP